jgi:predicted RNase H-like nuclease (RuvC/YqgF family)
MSNLIEQLRTAEESDGDTFLDMVESGLLRGAADALGAAEKRIEELDRTCTGLFDEAKRLQAKNERLKQRIEGLERDLDNERARGIHTCHSKCQRPLCVAHRRIEALERGRDIQKNNAKRWEELALQYKRENERLRAALRKYGMHGDKCGFTFCRCGLSEALAAVEGEGDA